MRKMLLLGDSISLHYGTYLNEYLKHEFEIHSKPGKEEALKKIDSAIGGNGGDSSMVLEYIKERQKEKRGEKEKGKRGRRKKERRGEGEEGRKKGFLRSPSNVGRGLLSPRVGHGFLRNPPCGGVEEAI